MVGRLTRRDFLKYVAWLTANSALSASAHGATKESSARPNFVFILADDLGWADVGCYGSDLHETPNIDRLARQGMRFTDAYAAAPVCSPTRASIMTGKYPARLHMTIWYESSANPPRNRRLIPPVTQGNMPHEQVTIAEVLKKAGYFTAHMVSGILVTLLTTPNPGLRCQYRRDFLGRPDHILLSVRRLEQVGWRVPICAAPRIRQRRRVLNRPPNRRGPSGHRKEKTNRSFSTFATTQSTRQSRASLSWSNITKRRSRRVCIIRTTNTLQW